MCDPTTRGHHKTSSKQMVKQVREVLRMKISPSAMVLLIISVVEGIPLCAFAAAGISVSPSTSCKK